MTREDAFRGMLARLGADTYARLELVPWDEWHEPSETGPQSLSCDTCGRIIEERA